MAHYQSKIPKFRQILDGLRQKILRHQFAAHAPLPSERLIAEEYGVSRMTARRALETLEAEGLAYSETRRGRFVSPQRLTYDLSAMVSFVADAEAKGHPLDITVLDQALMPATAEMARRLGVDEGATLCRYVRLFRSQGHPMFVESEAVIAQKFPGVESLDLRQSTTKLFETQYGIAAHRGDVTIRMAAVGPDEAKWLGLAPNYPCIELTQVIADKTGRRFCCGRQIWRGELAEFSAKTIIE